MIPQLRVRTEHSFRKAFGPIKRVVERLAEIDAPAAGIVDDATWGHAKWAKTATSPRFGVEVAIPRGEGLRPISWVLGREMRGFYRFSSAVLRESADPEQLLREYAPSLVRFAGAALEDPDLFDYVDINPASPLRQRAAIALAKRTGKPLVATSSAFYPGPTDEGAFLAIGGRETPSPQFLMGEVELRAALPAFSDGEWSKIRANTFEAAEAAASQLNKAGLIKVEGDLRALAAQGKAERLASGRLKAWTEVEEARLARELDLIESKDFSSYFLVVADLIRWSKTKMLVGPGRGSSSGSLLCFLIGITEVNPLDHGLLFERFVDLTRSDLPDIDIDFDDSKRELAFEYLSEKYGRDNVARIGSINTLKPRSAMFEACKRLAIPNKDRFDVINVLLEYSSGDARYGHGIEDTFANTEPGRKFLENYPAAEVVTKIENHAWHAGVHAAGVIVSNEPVIDFCTVTPEGIAQTDKKGAEQLNLLKIDALGLRTLGVLSDAGISQETLYNLPLDDPKVFEVFNQRRFCDIFQFEGAAMRSVSARVPITSFKQLDHITAIARPGPLVGGATGHYIDRAAGREEPTPPHPLMAESVADTFGVIIYQEQVMKIAKEVGGFSWEGVTFLRKAMSGRLGAEFFDKQGENFLAGATERGMPAAEATALWKSICTFGSWAMNACIKGSVKIKVANASNAVPPDATIEFLYEKYKVNPSPWIKQRKSMPVLLCVGDDGIARPTMAKDIIKSGKKECVKLTFNDGREIECTADHRFIINGRWQRCGNAKRGAKFNAVTRDHSPVDRALNPGKGRGWSAGSHWQDGKAPIINGKTPEKHKFKAANKGSPCEDCGATIARMEAHHNDFVGGNERPEDMAWLCSGCHKKRHIAHGDRRGPYARGHVPDEPAILESIESIGAHETYDIEMPAPHHNFVLANGIVTHNSHTAAYATISYWCAWAKAYTPLEFAAASLRRAKGDEHAFSILRELAGEGIGYIAFDAEKSQADWAAIDGKIVGGFTSLKGIGPAKAKTLIEKREKGNLTPEDLAKYLPSKFENLYPIRSKYAAMINDPFKHGCREGSVISPCAEMPEEGEVLLIGKMFKKTMRDKNEAILRAKRDGAYWKNKQSLFLDFWIIDDSGTPILCRIDPWRFEEIGRPFYEESEVDETEVLVRGKRIPNFSMLSIIKVRILNRKDKEAADATN